MIELHEVEKDYGPVVIGPLTFTVEPRSITGLLGPNGSGKTTTLCRMVELLRGNGTTLFDGSHYSDLNIPQQVVGMMFDSVPAHPGRSVMDHLRLAATTADVSRDRCDELLELVGLASVPKRRIDRLSLGMRQRLGIACALIGSPRYLVLDEPSIGLDPVGRVWFRDLLHSLAADGCAILLSTHDLEVVESIADRVVLMSKGRMLADSALKDLVAGSAGRNVDVTCELPHKAAEALAMARIGQCHSVSGNTVSIAEATIEEVCLCLTDVRVGISAIRYKSSSLHDMYISMIDQLDEHA